MRWSAVEPWKSAPFPRRKAMKNTNSMLRPASASLLALVLIAGATPRADARSWYPFPSDSRVHSTADGNLVDVQVKVDGRTAPLYFRPGTSDRHYFQAFQDRNYSVVLHNN